MVQNPGFETGNFNFWTRSGQASPAIVTGGHSGTYAARAGSASAFKGNSVFRQTVTVPSGAPTLTFWYAPSCADTIAHDQIQMQIRSTNGSKQLASVLSVCTNTGAWTQVTFNMSQWAGRSVSLWFNVHDDGGRATPTSALFDDISLG